MSEQQRQTRINSPTIPDGVVVVGDTIARRAIGSQNIDGAPAPNRAARIVFLTIVVVLGVGLAAVWTFIARRELASSIVAETTQRLDHAYTAFDEYRTREQDNLRAHCRVLVEDPRLKSTLATEGMDVATVADILNDLGTLRGNGFLMVLSPEGRVFAEAGAASLRGIDLSESSVVKKAQASPEAVVGSWVLDNQVMDLSIMAVRYGEAIIAFLVVGKAVDQSVLEAVADQSGVEVASALAGTVVLASTSDARIKNVFARVAGEAGAFSGRTMTIDGETYVTAVVELSGTQAQAQRLVLARATGKAAASYRRLEWMILAPPILVLIAMLFAISGTRMFRRK